MSSVQFSHDVQRGDTLSGIVSQYTGLNLAESGELSTQAASEAGIPVLSLDEWSKKFGVSSEKIMDQLKGSAAVRLSKDFTPEFVELNPNDVVTGTYSPEEGLKLQIVRDSQPLTNVLNPQVRTIDLRQADDAASTSHQFIRKGTYQGRPVTFVSFQNIYPQSNPSTYLTTNVYVGNPGDESIKIFEVSPIFQTTVTSKGLGDLGGYDVTLKDLQIGLDPQGNVVVFETKA